MSHDLTRDQKLALQKSKLEELRSQQIRVAAGEAEADLVPANRNPKFQVRKHEAHKYVHVFTRIKHLDQAQKNFIHEDRIHKIHVRDFDRRRADGMFRTYDEVEVIHDPRAGAPKSYELKPENVSVDKPAQPSVDPERARKEEELARREAEIAKGEAKLEELKRREEELAAKEAVLKAAETPAEAPDTPPAANQPETPPAKEAKPEGNNKKGNNKK